MRSSVVPVSVLVSGLGLWPGAEWTGSAPQIPWQPGHRHVQVHVAYIVGRASAQYETVLFFPMQKIAVFRYSCLVMACLFDRVHQLRIMYFLYVYVYDGDCGLVAMEIEVSCQSILLLSTMNS